MIADAALLTRILASLLADAAHRCPAGPPPALTAASARTAGSRSASPTRARTNAAVRPAWRSGSPPTSPRRWVSRSDCERTPSGSRTVIIILPAAARRPPGAPTREKYPDEEMQLS